MDELMIIESRGEIVVSSRAVAEKFKKRHNDVVAAIDNKIKNLTTEKFVVKDYFILSHYEHNGNLYKEYLLTRDGFSFMVMGFTGKDADLWKIKYIQAFNRMEIALKERQSTEWLITRKQGKLIRRNETDVIAELIDYAQGQGSKNMQRNAYAIYTKLVNSLVGIEAGERDSVPFKTIMVIGMLEDMIMHTIREGMAAGVYYKEIYKRCKANGEQMMQFAYLPKLSA